MHALRHLDLSNNLFTFVSGTSLFKALSFNETLETLNLTNNYLQDATGKEVVNTFKYNTKLVRVLIGHNQINYTLMNEIEACLLRNRQYAARNAKPRLGQQIIDMKVA